MEKCQRKRATRSHKKRSGKQVKYYLDIDVIIEYLKDKNSASARLILEFKDEVAITTITLYELYYGPMGR